MTTETITRALRNATSPQARLAAYPNGYGPQLSSPEAPLPLLWVTGEEDQEILAVFDSDSLRMRNACAWYIDEHCDETIETVAVILARFPRLMFYGVRESISDSIRIELSKWELINFEGCESEKCAYDARADKALGMLHSNDNTTEREAEESREFNRIENVKYQIEENREELKTLRAYIRQLTGELRGEHGWMLTNLYPVAAKACRDSLRRALADRRELMASNVTLTASI